MQTAEITSPNAQLQFRQGLGLNGFWGIFCLFFGVSSRYYKKIKRNKLLKRPPFLKSKLPITPGRELGDHEGIVEQEMDLQNPSLIAQIWW